MNKDKILQSARRAKLPDFCIEKLDFFYKKIQESNKENFFLSCMEKCKDHTLKDEEILREFPAAEEADLFRMLLITALIPYGEKCYKNKNIPLEIFEENLLDAPIWLEYHMDNYAYPGFQWRIVEWCRTLWEGNILKFGRLQLETAGEYKESFNTYRTKENRIVFASEEEAEKDWECVLKKGDRIVSIHIPASGPLIKEQCIASFTRMRTYLSRYRPDIDYKAIRCSSWLLDPQLKDILPANSNILAFQSLGHVKASGTYKTETVGRVFGEKAIREGINAVPHRTNMQKALAAFAEKGGRFDNGVMLILRNEFDALCDGKYTSVPE